MIHTSSEWNQPRCPSTDVRTVKMWQYTHGILFICKENIKSAEKMDESGKYYINQSGPDSERQLSHVHSLVNPNF